jgi:adenosylcobinamide kinase/adenosylcobinamide-phosphate guanylyltransferase
MALIQTNSGAGSHLPDGPSDPVTARSVLVLGGARSGKSAYAQSLAEATAPQRIYVATAEAGDAEMAARIARHRAERGDGWTTLEEPLALADALRAQARAGRALLVDCLTLWLSNVMLAGREAEAEVARLADAIRTLEGPAVIVSNEVGLGIVPEHKLGRAFRDAQGRANAEIARACDAVILVVAGLPALLKPAPHPALALR